MQQALEHFEEEKVKLKSSTSSRFHLNTEYISDLDIMDLNILPK